MAEGQAAGKHAAVALITRPLRMRHATTRIRRLWEAGVVVVPASILASLEPHGHSLLDFEHIIAKGRVVDDFTQKEDRRTHVYVVVGLTVDGHPARFTIEIRGRRGKVAGFTWLAAR